MSDENSKSKPSKTFLSSAFSRSVKLAEMAAKVAKTELSHTASALINGQSPASLLKARITQAEQVVESLGSMKGAAMKFGQMLALEARDFLPDEAVSVLDRLQNNAEPMPTELVRSILQNELGEKYSLINDLSATPIAAASIGQVHSATIDGKKVVLKIQYPGVAESIQSDVKILGKMTSLLSTLSGRSEMDFKPLIQEVYETFLQEVDYTKELENLNRFSKLTPDWIRVPEGYSSYSTSRVLTLSYETGSSVSDLVRTKALSQSQREYFADAFMKLCAIEFCEWGLVQTDPNLGNFLLRPSAGELVLLDFGATKEYDLAFRKAYSQLIVTALNGNRQECIERSIEMKLIDPREDAEARDCIVDLILESMTPFKAKQYDFNDSTYPEAMRQKGIVLAQKLKYSAPPKQILFLHRKLGGIFQILRRLEVSMNLEPYLEHYKKLASQ